MTTNAALFLFLGAAVISVFAFCSIVVWVNAPLRQRQARERMDLLKLLTEHPGQQAAQILEMLREEERRRAENIDRVERRNWVAGGAINMAVGAGMGVMLFVLGSHGAWSAAVIPFLIGVVLVLGGVFSFHPSALQRKD